MSVTDAPALRETTPRIWFDGVLVDAAAPHAALTTHAMHYGSGVFEGIRSYATPDGAARTWARILSFLPLIKAP
ncbi:TPA: hypothetical protein RNS88_003090 [Stenotrophomonas maltophilia]|nr:hypothetical protein [Stenotrophomonas maltophilia]